MGNRDVSEMPALVREFFARMLEEEKELSEWKRKREDLEVNRREKSGFGQLMENLTPVYNEESLKFEFCVFLKERLGDEYRIDLERDITDKPFPGSAADTENIAKSKIDVYVYSLINQNNRCAIEFKYPRNGQVSEQLNSFAVDICFMEDVADILGARTYCVAVASNRTYYEKRISDNEDGLYKMFRTLKYETKELVSHSLSEATGDNAEGIRCKYKRQNEVRTKELKRGYAIKWNLAAVFDGDAQVPEGVPYLDFLKDNSGRICHADGYKPDGEYRVWASPLYYYLVEIEPGKT